MYAYALITIVLTLRHGVFDVLQLLSFSSYTIFLELHDIDFGRNLLITCSCRH